MPRPIPQLICLEPSYGCDQGCLPELAIQYAMILPMSHAHTQVAGPPEAMGIPNSAGTEPSTPKIEMAYDTVDHLEK